MRILFISSYPPEEGGIPNYTETLIRVLKELLEYEDKIYVICTRKHHLRSSFIETSVDRKLSIIEIPITTPLHYAFALIKNVLRIRPNVIHIQYPLMLTLRDRIRRVGPLCEPLLLLLLMLKFIHRIPTVVTMHEVWPLTDAKVDILRYVRSRSLASILTWYLMLFMALFLRAAGRVITLTNYGKRILGTQYGIPENKVKVLPHGIDFAENTDMAHAKSKLNIDATHIILFFGYIWPAKGIEYVLEAMPYINSSVKDPCLIIAGPLNPVDGDRYLRKLLSIRNKMKLERSVLIDARYIPKRELMFYFSAASLVVVPYNMAVGSSGPIHLAFGYKKPVVSTNVGCRIEELGAGDRGLLVPPKSPKDIANAICRIINDDTLRESIVKNIEKYIQRNNWTALVKRTIEEYKRMYVQRVRIDDCSSI